MNLHTFHSFVRHVTKNYFYIVRNPLQSSFVVLIEKWSAWPWPANGGNNGTKRSLIFKSALMYAKAVVASIVATLTKYADRPDTCQEAIIFSSRKSTMGGTKLIIASSSMSYLSSAHRDQNSKWPLLKDQFSWWIMIAWIRKWKNS